MKKPYFQALPHSELQKFIDQLKKQNPAMAKRILKWATNKENQMQKEIKGFKFEDGFLNPCEHGVQAYFYYLAEKEGMELIIKKFKRKVKKK